jgi:hypothetical protein
MTARRVISVEPIAPALGGNFSVAPTPSVVAVGSATIVSSGYDAPEGEQLAGKFSIARIQYDNAILVGNRRKL